MAIEHGMIEPFAERQVREGVISYGVSSYGYDLRVSDEFKIFTNVYTATVDPKDFDPRSFVDWKAETCIVPPNSFALARSVEYFRIPRNVLTICVGKSTYARCFSGDTRVALVDGSAPTIEELADRHQNGNEMFWGYSVGQYGRIIVALLDAPRHIGSDSLLEIHFDNEEVIRCTPDHEFIRRDGRVVRAADLRGEDSLMPLYRQHVRGYEAVYQPVNGHIYPTHRLADEWNVRNGVYEDEPETHRHHKDRDRLNNNPWNLERMAAGDHIRLHNEDTFGGGFDGEAHAERIRDALARRAQDPEWCARYRGLQRERALRFWADEQYAGTRERLRQTRIAAWKESRRHRSVFRRFPQVLTSHAPRARNHRVKSVRNLPGTHDVYCLTVPEAGNFALAAGVFALNCGIIVNVTPFEPEWEGHVTLEISNTTPLPAKIYANEGIAQVLFFESDEPPETSYADRGGKYQAQRGVTLPKL